MEKRRKFTPDAARVEGGRLLCPYCGGYMGDAYYGAAACHVELKCRNDRCKKMMRLEL